jgi:translin
MDEIYTILTSMDFSDAVTGGLRRSVDQARGILERTRGDYTNHVVSKRLRDDLGKHVAPVGS